MRYGEGRATHSPRLAWRELPVCWGRGGTPATLRLVGLAGDNGTAQRVRSKTICAFLFVMTLFHNQVLGCILLGFFFSSQFVAGESF